MSDMLSVVSGFQYSVNLNYDLNHDDKLNNFIPTKFSLDLLKDIFRSLSHDSSDRARVLVGAYGKGKSHIVLAILSLLMQKDRRLFVHLIPKIEEDAELKRLVEQHYSLPNNKLLPVVISGTSASLPQAFLLALQRTLTENGLMNIMPETNFRAAVSVIGKWKKEYPDTYSRFKNSISLPVGKFIEELNDYSVAAYEEFERVYPELTSGSIFNPFIGFDTVELYDSVVKSLKKKGYAGIYVVYDEFSKFLEANILSASVSDTKMLQNFAEMCNRSGENQLHVLLISHKEISNYIDRLPKQKIDGWRGVSGRFKHMHINDSFEQVYEVIAAVIKKEPSLWKKFKEKHCVDFDALFQRYSKHAIFEDMDTRGLEDAVLGCYPLHPVSTFILPRLSERVAQNERTLFTFLSADGTATLKRYLESGSEGIFDLLTPDVIFDYFEPLMLKESTLAESYQNYLLTASVLEKLRGRLLESKIVKSLSLIYTIAQFDKLSPTKEELAGIYGTEFSAEQIETAIKRLVDEDYVVYLKRSNGYLKLKRTSGVDIKQKINDTAAAQSANFSLKDVLTQENLDSYLYPSRYNDEHEMIRYFSVVFVEENELDGAVNWNVKSQRIKADGVVFAVIPNSVDSIEPLKDKITKSSEGCQRCFFVLPRRYSEIREIAREFSAVSELRTIAGDDSVLFNEYEAVYEDLREVIETFISGFTRPEEGKSIYIYNGKEQRISRKASLTELASDICEEVYSQTPVINNEAINKDEITSVAWHSRNKILSGLLRNELDKNLGLTGTGQEVSIMRSTLLRTNVLVNDEMNAHICLSPNNERMKGVLDMISTFISSSRNGCVSFAELYDTLTSPEHHIGLRQGVIPIYTAAVFHEYKRDVVIQRQGNQIPLLPETFELINENPGDYQLLCLNWDEDKEEFIRRLSEIFKEQVREAEEQGSVYEFAANAMRRWYLALPKYAKEANRQKADKRYSAMMRLLKQDISAYELLFSKLPSAFGYDGFSSGLAENIQAAKQYYDSAVSMLKTRLLADTIEVFSVKNRAVRAPLQTIIKDWLGTLSPTVFEQMFSDGTDRCLNLFQTGVNDNNTLIVRLAKLATDLRVEDWDSNTETVFIEQLKRYRTTAEAFHEEADSSGSSDYEITYHDKNGTPIRKRFSKVEMSGKGRLLRNSILADIDSMGSSISVQEKRQVLLDIINEIR